MVCIDLVHGEAAEDYEGEKQRYVLTWFAEDCVREKQWYVLTWFTERLQRNMREKNNGMY